MTRQIWIRLSVILLLALLPFFLFMGETNTIREHGRVVGEQRLNHLGFILAAVGLGLALTLVFRRSLSERLDAEPSPRRARIMAALLALFCLGQMALTVELVRLEPLEDIWADASDEIQDRIAIWRGLRPPAARDGAGLPEDDISGYRHLAEEKDEDELRELIAIARGRVLVLIEQYDTYAGRCFGGRYTLADLTPPPAPASFGAAEQAISQRARIHHYQRFPPLLCADQATVTQMDAATADASLLREGLVILNDGYLRRFGAGR